MAVVVAGKEFVPKALKEYSQDAVVISSHNLTWERNPEKEEGEKEMEGSQVNGMSWVRGCILFFSSNAMVFLQIWEPSIFSIQISDMPWAIPTMN